MVYLLVDFFDRITGGFNRLATGKFGPNRPVEIGYLWPFIYGQKLTPAFGPIQQGVFIAQAPGISRQFHWPRKNDRFGL